MSPPDEKKAIQKSGRESGPALPETLKESKDQTRAELGREAFTFRHPGRIGFLLQSVIGQIPSPPLTLQLSEAETRQMLGANYDKLKALAAAQQENGAAWKNTSAIDQNGNPGKNRLWNSEHAGLQSLINDKKPLTPAQRARYKSLHDLLKADPVLASEVIGIKVSEGEAKALHGDQELRARYRDELLRLFEIKYLKEPNWKPGPINDKDVLDRLAKIRRREDQPPGVTSPGASPAATDTIPKTAVVGMGKAEPAAKPDDVLAAPKAVTRSPEPAAKAADAPIAKGGASRVKAGAGDELDKKSERDLLALLREKIPETEATKPLRDTLAQHVTERDSKPGVADDPALKGWILSKLKDVEATRLTPELLTMASAEKFGVPLDKPKDEEAKNEFSKLIASLKDKVGTDPGKNQDLRDVLSVLPFDAQLAQRLNTLNNFHGKKISIDGDPTKTFTMDQERFIAELRALIIHKKEPPPWYQWAVEHPGLATAAAIGGALVIPPVIRGVVKQAKDGRDTLATVVENGTRAVLNPKNWVKPVVGTYNYATGGAEGRAARRDERQRAAFEAQQPTQEQARQNLGTELIERQLSGPEGIRTTRGALQYVRGLQQDYANDPQLALRESARHRAVTDLARRLDVLVTHENRGDEPPEATIRHWSGIDTASARARTPAPPRPAAPLPPDADATRPPSRTDRSGRSWGDLNPLKGWLDRRSRAAADSSGSPTSPDHASDATDPASSRRTWRDLNPLRRFLDRSEPAATDAGDSSAPTSPTARRRWRDLFSRSPATRDASSVAPETFVPVSPMHAPIETPTVSIPGDSTVAARPSVTDPIAEVPAPLTSPTSHIDTTTPPDPGSPPESSGPVTRTPSRPAPLRGLFDRRNPTAAASGGDATNTSVGEPAAVNLGLDSTPLPADPSPHTNAPESPVVAEPLSPAPQPRSLFERRRSNEPASADIQSALQAGTEPAVIDGTAHATSQVDAAESNMHSDATGADSLHPELSASSGISPGEPASTPPQNSFVSNPAIQQEFDRNLTRVLGGSRAVDGENLSRAVQAAVHKTDAARFEQVEVSFGESNESFTTRLHVIDRAGTSYVVEGRQGELITLRNTDDNSSHSIPAKNSDLLILRVELPAGLERSANDANPAVSEPAKTQIKQATANALNYAEALGARDSRTFRISDPVTESQPRTASSPAVPSTEPAGESVPPEARVSSVPARATQEKTAGQAAEPAATAQATAQAHAGHQTLHPVQSRSDSLRSVSTDGGNRIAPEDVNRQSSTRETAESHGRPTQHSAENAGAPAAGHATTISGESHSSAEGGTPTDGQSTARATGEGGTPAAGQSAAPAAEEGGTATAGQSRSQTAGEGLARVAGDGTQARPGQLATEGDAHNRTDVSDSSAVKPAEVITSVDVVQQSIAGRYFAQGQFYQPLYEKAGWDSYIGAVRGDLVAQADGSPEQQAYQKYLDSCEVARASGTQTPVEHMTAIVDPHASARTTFFNNAAESPEVEALLKGTSSADFETVRRLMNDSIERGNLAEPVAAQLKEKVSELTYKPGNPNVEVGAKISEILDTTPYSLVTQHRDVIAQLDDIDKWLKPLDESRATEAARAAGSQTTEGVNTPADIASMPSAAHAPDEGKVSGAADSATPVLPPNVSGTSAELTAGAAAVPAEVNVSGASVPTVANVSGTNAGAAGVPSAPVDINISGAVVRTAANVPGTNAGATGGAAVPSDSGVSGTVAPNVANVSGASAAPAGAAVVTGDAKVSDAAATAAPGAQGTTARPAAGSPAPAQISTQGAGTHPGAPAGDSPVAPVSANVASGAAMRPSNVSGATPPSAGTGGAGGGTAAPSRPSAPTSPTKPRDVGSGPSPVVSDSARGGGRAGGPAVESHNLAAKYQRATDALLQSDKPLDARSLTDLVRGVGQGTALPKNTVVVFDGAGSTPRILLDDGQGHREVIESRSGNNVMIRLSDDLREMKSVEQVRQMRVVIEMPKELASVADDPTSSETAKNIASHRAIYELRQAVTGLEKIAQSTAPDRPFVVGDHINSANSRLTPLNEAIAAGEASAEREMAARDETAMKSREANQARKEAAATAAPPTPAAQEREAREAAKARNEAHDKGESRTRVRNALRGDNIPPGRPMVWEEAQRRPPRNGEAEENSGGNAADSASDAKAEVRGRSLLPQQQIAQRYFEGGVNLGELYTQNGWNLLRQQTHRDVQACNQRSHTENEQDEYEKFYRTMPAEHILNDPPPPFSSVDKQLPIERLANILDPYGAQRQAFLSDLPKTMHEAGLSETLLEDTSPEAYAQVGRHIEATIKKIPGNLGLKNNITELMQGFVRASDHPESVQDRLINLHDATPYGQVQMHAEASSRTGTVSDWEKSLESRRTTEVREWQEQARHRAPQIGPELHNDILNARSREQRMLETARRQLEERLCDPSRDLAPQDLAKFANASAREAGAETFERPVVKLGESGGPNTTRLHLTNRAGANLRVDSWQGNAVSVTNVSDGTALAIPAEAAKQMQLEIQLPSKLSADMNASNRDVRVKARIQLFKHITGAVACANDIGSASDAPVVVADQMEAAVRGRPKFIREGGAGAKTEAAAPGDAASRRPTETTQPGASDAPQGGTQTTAPGRGTGGEVPGAGRQPTAPAQRVGGDVPPVARPQTAANPGDTGQVRQTSGTASGRTGDAAVSASRTGTGSAFASFRPSDPDRNVRLLNPDSAGYKKWEIAARFQVDKSILNETALTNLTSRARDFAELAIPENTQVKLVNSGDAPQIKFTDEHERMFTIQSRSGGTLIASSQPDGSNAASPADFTIDYVRTKSITIELPSQPNINSSDPTLRQQARQATTRLLQSSLDCLHGVFCRVSPGDRGVNVASRIEDGYNRLSPAPGSAEASPATGHETNPLNRSTGSSGGGTEGGALGDIMVGSQEIMTLKTHISQGRPVEELDLSKQISKHLEAELSDARARGAHDEVKRIEGKIALWTDEPGKYVDELVQAHEAAAKETVAGEPGKPEGRVSLKGILKANMRLAGGATGALLLIDAALIERQSALERARARRDSKKPE